MNDDTDEPKVGAEDAIPRQAPRQGPEVIKSFLKRLPGAPGVYRMIGNDGEVLYVGKAKNLKNRVSSYAKFGGHTARIARMIASTVDMEFVRTQTEIEALLLESNLIKKLRPRFNVLLRDDKSFAHILVREDHAFPQILKHRGAKSTKGKYFGPFASAGAVNQTLNTLHRAFLLRPCSDSVFENRTRPCLQYQIKRCSAPCTGEISRPDYLSLVDDAVDFLNGKDERVKAGLAGRMEDAAERLDFESAANYRDRIKALSHIQQRQGINPTTIKDADVIALHAEGGQSCVEVFFFRSGQNWGNHAYFPRHDKSEPPTAILESFLGQFYDNKDAPPLILLSESVPRQALLSEALSLRAERKVEVTVPQRGEKKALVAQAKLNARDALGRRMADTASQAKLLVGVAEAFDLDTPPDRIEVYDNSHIQGSHAVGGMIVAGPEGFEKGQYRKFNMKSEDTVPGDDYGMMREVIRRRFTRLLKASATDKDGALKQEYWPDLILIDGGPGQLSSVLEVFDELGIDDTAVVSIAKGEERNAGRERFFLPNREPFHLEPSSPVLYYLQRLRDEAHRFAIGTHRARRTKAMGVTTLDEIPGIGASRKRALLGHFGSAKGVERAGLSDLEAVDGISSAMAKRIYDFFRGDE